MKIVTLTLNPSLDKNTSVDMLQPSKKLRCEYPSWEPGGGGINVSRAIKILGGESLAVIAAGGGSGEKIQDILKDAGIEFKCICTRNPTRENLMVMEESTNNQYRFGMPGNEINEKELQETMEIIKSLPDDTEYLVISGSLPPGAGDDFYKKLISVAKEKGIKCILDTSGEALTIAAGEGVFLLKPNLRELSQLAGKNHVTGLEQEEIAQKIISEGKTEILVLSLGARGAMIATGDKTEYVAPPTVKKDSTVGAGDSMVAGIVLSLSRGESLHEAVKWGVAAGTAATMTPGTELCRREDVERIYEWLDGK